MFVLENSILISRSGLEAILLISHPDPKVLGVKTEAMS